MERDLNWTPTGYTTYLPSGDKKQLKKDYVLSRKNVAFFQNCSYGTGGFAEKWCDISPFLLFFDKKQLKKDYVVGGKKRYIFSKLSLWHREFLLIIGLNSHLLFRA